MGAQERPDSQTHLLLACLDRMRGGDAAARNELFRHFGNRLEHLTRKMLRGFPGVRRWAGTDDVLQNAALRLLKALEQVQPVNTREFLALSARQIRRELLDLTRHYYGPEGLGAHHDSGANAPEPANQSLEPSAIMAWFEFHERIQTLKHDERELVDMLYYQGLTQVEAAIVLQVSVRTLQRRWQALLVKLHDMLRDQWPRG